MVLLTALCKDIGQKTQWGFLCPLNYTLNTCPFLLSHLSPSEKGTSHKHTSVHPFKHCCRQQLVALLAEGAGCTSNIFISVILTLSPLPWCIKVCDIFPYEWELGSKYVLVLLLYVLSLLLKAISQCFQHYWRITHIIELW